MISRFFILLKLLLINELIFDKLSFLRFNILSESEYKSNLSRFNFLKLFSLEKIRFISDIE